MKKSLKEAIEYLDDWGSSRFQEIEDAINSYVDGSIREIELYREQSLKRLEIFKSGSEKSLKHLITRMEKMEESIDKVVTPRERWVEWEVNKAAKARAKEEGPKGAPRGVLGEPDVKLLQALSYTVFDTILFCITSGEASDFALISQAVLFECVYNNISRGYSSYLFKDVPHSGVAAIYQGKSILKELREEEPDYLDSEKNWDKYAPIIQKWWVNVALPIVFGEMDPDWSKAHIPTRDQMLKWADSDLNKLSTFPAVYDLMELSKTRSSEIAARYSFKPYMDVV